MQFSSWLSVILKTPQLIIKAFDTQVVLTLSFMSKGVAYLKHMWGLVTYTVTLDQSLAI